MAEREHDMIARLLAPLASGFEGALGLRDDAASLSAPAGETFVVTLDTSIAGRHFLFDASPGDAELAARKALAVNVSDLVAKGARPHCYLLSLELPENHAGWIDAFAAGLGAAQADWGLKLAGGDTVTGVAQLGVSITAVGTVPAGAMIRRDTAKPGDILVVSGSIGDAWAGLSLLRPDGPPQPDWQGSLSAAARERLIARSRAPEPRTGLVEAVRNHASAALDVSDGLAIDASRLAAASGLSAVIELGAVPIEPELAERVRDGRLDARELVTGGDDYEVLVAVSPARLDAYLAAGRTCGVALTPIGHLSQGEGLSVIDSQGGAVELSRLGWDHFGD